MKNSLWPKLKRDWKGLRVRSKYPMENRGGGIFPAGTIFIVEGYYRELSIKREEACKECCCRGWASLSRVNQNSVELVPTNSIQLIMELNDDKSDPTV